VQRFSSTYCSVSILVESKSRKENDSCVSLPVFNYSTIYLLMLPVRPECLSILAEKSPARRGESGEGWWGKKDTGYLYKALMVARRPPTHRFSQVDISCD
jgi:hypothetical protein